MARVRDFLAEFMLEHISSILNKYPIFVGEYTFGQRVKAVEDSGGYIIETIGTVCGIEFFGDEYYNDAGIYYFIKVESSIATFPDGRVFNYGHDRCERILSNYVQPLITTPVVTPFKFTV